MKNKGNQATFGVTFSLVISDDANSNHNQAIGALDFFDLLP